MLSLLSPPAFADEQQTQTARMLYTVAVLTALIVNMVIPVVMVAQPDAFWRGVRVIVVVNALALATLAVNRRGRTDLATWMYLVVILGLLTFNAVSSEGIRSPGVQAYFIFVMLAGLLLGERSGVIVGVACALLGLGLVVGESRGLLSSAQTFYNPISRWLLTCVFIGVALLTMRLGVGAVRTAFDRAQRELKERRATQQRLEQALDAGAIGTFDHDLQAGTFRGDGRALALTGLSAGADGTVPYKAWESLVHPDDRQRLASELQEFAEGLRHGRTHYRIRRPDGVQRHLEAAAYMTTDDRGRPAITGMIMDVTEGKEAERERERLVLSLGERVKELRLLHSAAQLLQRRRPMERGLLAELVALIPLAWRHPEDCRARIVYQEMDVFSPGWTPSPWSQSASFTTSSGRGAIEVIYLTEHPPSDEGPFLKEERALIDSLAQMLRSHIEEHVAEQQRHGLESQLRQAQKMDALGTLAGGIAHDFNNLLTAIGGNAELALAETPPGSAPRESLDEIVKAHARARDLVKRILLFSRQQESVRKVIVLPSVVDEALGLLRASLPANIQVRTAVAAALPPVFADATQMHQIIMNLGTNAGHAMREPGGTLSVDLDTVAIGDVAGAPSADLGPGLHVRIAVRDTGTGMSQAVRDRLFEPFFTTKGHAGTGLGLSVVHGIVRDHGGAITVDSELGLGTVFTIYLPASVAGEERAVPGAAGLVRGAGQHIMYVDDEEALVLLMSRSLERLGYECTAFTSADTALQAFRTNPHGFAAVVTDMQMATLSGLELLRAMREVRPDLPVAVASGYGGEDALGTTVRWIQKPTTLVDLSHALSDMLRPAASPSR